MGDLPESNGVSHHDESNTVPLHDESSTSIRADYDLSQPITSTSGLRSGLTSYGDTHFSLFLRKVFIKSLGYSDDALSRPIIGIINTYSSFNACHSNVPQLIEACKRGIMLAGGLPIDFPTISIHESFASPTSMYLRNLMSMDTEEMINSQPVDAVVMIGGCDKTVPAQLMGGISANKPILPLITGPMMPGSVDGVRVGACTDCRSYWAKYRAGEIDLEDIMAVNSELAPTGGTCGVMGTASTMACIAAAMGLIDLRSGATAAAVSSARLRIAENTGKSAVAMLGLPNMTPQDLLTRESFLNAIIVLQAIGEQSITLLDIDSIGRTTPLLVDLKPSGQNYMTDFHNAGGMLALMHTLKPLLHLSARTYTGQTLEAYLTDHPFTPSSTTPPIIAPLSTPIYPNSSLAVLTGNLAPKGCIIKASAASPDLLSHSGPALVFTSTTDMAARIDSPTLSVTPNSILILQSIGPVGNPGMPEAGLIPIPQKLAREGVRDMLRISDGRMSGTAKGSVVLHVSPESADLDSVFGVVRTGDVVGIDVEQRRIWVDVGEEELRRRVEERKKMAETGSRVEEGGGTKEIAEGSGEGTGGGGKEERRREQWLERRTRRGYRGLYERHVNQADQGCDFDFLTALYRGPS